jgi:hypothetical protein
MHAFSGAGLRIAYDNCCFIECSNDNLPLLEREMCILLCRLGGRHPGTFGAPVD